METVKVIIVSKNETKSIFKSKTFYVGLLQVLAGVMLAVAGELQTGGALTASGVATVALRAVTKEAVKLTK